RAILRGGLSRIGHDAPPTVCGASRVRRASRDRPGARWRRMPPPGVATHHRLEVVKAPATTLNREILRLAVPALGALVAEPAFLIVDAALVGHLGVVPLAGLGI